MTTGKSHSLLEQLAQRTQNIRDCNARSRALAEKCVNLEEQLETIQRILIEERRWIADARDWYRDHRSSKGDIYDENTWGDPFAVPGEAGALPPSPVASGADVSPPVPSPESVSHAQARAALVELLKLRWEDRVQCVVEDTLCRLEEDEPAIAEFHYATERKGTLT